MFQLVDIRYVSGTLMLHDTPERIVNRI